MNRKDVLSPVALAAVVGLAVVGAAASADQALTIGVPDHSRHGNPPDFCEYALIQGQLQGGQAGVKVELFQKPYPFKGDFKSTGLSAVTNAAGGYSIKVTPRVLTDYHVVASTVPSVQSSDFRERARTCAVVHASDTTPKRGQMVRFFGTVSPAKNGRRIKLLAPNGRGGTPIAGVTLRPNNASSSKFSASARVTKSGYYGVELRADAANELGGGGVDIKVH